MGSLEKRFQSGQSRNKKPKENELVKDSRWLGYEVPPTGNANYGWILHILSKLLQNGVAGFLLANGSQTGDGTEYLIRKQLIEAEDQFVQLTHDKEILSKYIVLFYHLLLWKISLNWRDNNFVIDAMWHQSYKSKVFVEILFYSKMEKKRMQI